ncbi:MAG: hypothetical protein ACK51N_03925 [bacterium]|jgi:hypothetical protein
MTMKTTLLMCVMGCALACGGCASKPAAEVSSKELAAARAAHAELKPGASRQAVLDSFKAGNLVKLGNSSMAGAAIEEWKYEAFHDEKERKNLFVTFLYFCNDRFVDSSDQRIDFRNNEALVAKWIGKPSK